LRGTKRGYDGEEVAIKDGGKRIDIQWAKGDWLLIPEGGSDDAAETSQNNSDSKLGRAGIVGKPAAGPR
jgi:hypothetical protein